MVKFFFTYNGQMNTEYDVIVMTRPPRPSPEREYDEIKVEGRDGTLYEDKGTYADIEIPVSLNFKAEPDEWQERMRRVRSWLLKSGDNKLIFSDDANYYYRVKKVVIGDTARSLKRVGKFTVTFVCEPYVYLVQGDEVTDVTDVIVNLWEVTQPIYYIFGVGKISLTVNGETIEADIEGNLTIDTKLGLCYVDGENIKNTAMTGDYESLYLQPGENTISYSEGFEVMLRPNWRCI